MNKEEGITIRRRIIALLLTVASMISLTACANSKKQDESALNAEVKPATQYTVDANQQVYALLDFSDTAAENGQIIVSTAEELQAALSCAKPGDTVLLKEGVYVGHFVCETDGTEEAPVRICACPGERAAVTVPKNSSGAAFCLNGRSGISICNITFADMQAKKVYGVLFSGGEKNITIKNCEFTNIKTTAPGTENKPGGEANAILLFGETEEPISNVLIENNRVHDNINGWSENISVAGNCEYVYVYNNEIQNCSNIGIDFCGNAGYCADLSLDMPRNCECIGNTVYNCVSTYAENAGIYVDGAYNILVEDNEVFGNPYGIEIGSEVWRPIFGPENRVRNIMVRNNYIHNNSECGLRLGGWTADESTGTVYSCDIVRNRFEENNAEIILSKCDTARFIENEFAGSLATERAVQYDDAIPKSMIRNILFG